MQLQVRRATLEDIGPLMSLWTSMQFDTEELARRITEFQMVETADGGLIGAAGLQIVDRQGLIHSEAFVDFAYAERARPFLWERLQSVANNHGLLRIWTRETAPFWSRCGLGRADEQSLRLLPDCWQENTGRWLTLKLRDDLDTIMGLDKEFALFMQAEKLKSQRTLQRARILKIVATLLAFALFALVLGAAFVLVRRQYLLNAG